MEREINVKINHTSRIGTTEGHFRMSMPSLMKQFKKMYNDYNIRDIIGNAEQLREMFDWERITLDCVHSSGHFDLHQQMVQENLAACFSLSMYLPHLHELNLYNDNKLLVFPIKDLTETNPVYILTNKDNAYVEGTDEFKHLLKNSVKDLEVSDM